ncbi:alpha/beta hydrolase [Actimicrobium sp. CCI2.3]|uniref:alpha/beta fold hydrolase n=1 Tax=Actimicrobium sp. CCI2.3 TaxID=3048616 RepID=UPI002AB363A5|nr:alpha/beta hydrolase [Actimicrobium sp. CCI2.3]MDY7574023.1 alpha/beta hydrolase [Actimicrobium sp. CCI2.3]MEB0021869.1 alpha/beta hydrolase [Actimicrobium sp. CCI2.3]
MLRNFSTAQCEVNGVTIHCRHGGTGPPLLLLHGFPQTHLIWHKIADRLAEHYTLVMPDLRGYGDSSKPPGETDHANYSKRIMAQDMVELMAALGHRQFRLCAHDRGARVAHRLALDHPQAVRKLMLIDIAPTLTMYDATDKAFATLYYHWFMLIQPAPLPETLIGNSARFFLEFTLGGWGSHGTDFIDADAMAEYRRCFCNPAAIHAACEDYRASAGIDLEHDRSPKKIACPLHLVWGKHGVVGRLFEPLANWQEKCHAPVSGSAFAAGHFIPEQSPELLLAEMLDFFSQPDSD